MGGLGGLGVLGRPFGAGLLAAAAFLATPSARGNPADVFGIGSRSVAMGGAVAADVHDFSANYYNPSGLVRAEGTDLSLGYMTTAHRLEINGHDSRIDPVRGIVGGLVTPGRIGSVPFAFGLATHLSDDRISRARTFRREDPRWVLYDNRSQLLYLSANIALAPIDGLALGGGLSFLAATRGGFSITGRAVLPDATGATEYDSELRHEVDADLTAIRYPQAGITVSPKDWLDLALVYRHEASVDLEIDAVLDGEVQRQVLTVDAQYELVSRTINHFLPRQAVLGASARPIETLRLGFDLTWVDWSSYESPISRSRTTLDIALPSLAPPPPEPSPKIDPKLRDRFVPRLGVEWTLPVAAKLAVPLRAGYLFEASPVPPQTGATNFVDADRHALSLGSGIVVDEPGELLPGNLRFDLHAQLSLLPERTTLKKNPADFVGDYRAGGSILAVGGTFSVGFR